MACVLRVVTDQGVVECEHVLLCTNVWASVLAKKVGIRFPLLGVEHQYAITEPLEEMGRGQRSLHYPPDPAPPGFLALLSPGLRQLRDRQLSPQVAAFRW